MRTKEVPAGGALHAQLAARLSTDLTTDPMCNLYGLKVMSTPLKKILRGTPSAAHPSWGLGAQTARTHLSAAAALCSVHDIELLCKRLPVCPFGLR